jgi:hypothetical protein
MMPEARGGERKGPARALPATQPTEPAHRAGPDETQRREGAKAQGGGAEPPSHPETQSRPPTRSTQRRRGAEAQRMRALRKGRHPERCHAPSGHCDGCPPLGNAVLLGFHEPARSPAQTPRTPACCRSRRRPPAARSRMTGGGLQAAGAGERGAGSGSSRSRAPTLTPPPAACRPHPEPEARISTEPGPCSVGKSSLIRAFRRKNQVDPRWSARHVCREEQSRACRERMRGEGTCPDEGAPSVGADPSAPPR